MNAYRFRILWATLMLLGLFYPFIAYFQLTGLALLLKLISTLILVSSIYALGDNRRHLLVAAVMIVPAIVLDWTETFVPSPPLELVVTFFQVAALSFVAFHILGFALRAGRVDLGPRPLGIGQDLRGVHRHAGRVPDGDQDGDHGQDRNERPHARHSIRISGTYSWGGSPGRVAAATKPSRR